MTLLRRIACIPVAAAVTFLCGILWSSAFTTAYYSEHSLLHSVVGLAPSFFGRFLPVALFIVISTVVAPRPGKYSVAAFGLLGGIYGWPFGPEYVVATSGPTFYLVEGSGSIAGAAFGLLLAFAHVRYLKGPNQALLPTPTAVTTPAGQESRQP
jgi:hypothetical protein